MAGVNETNAPGCVERMLTGFFGGWEPADKLAFVFIVTAFAFAAIGRIEVSRVLDYAFGFLSGRGVGVSAYGMGWQPPSLGIGNVLLPGGTANPPAEIRGDE